MDYEKHLQELSQETLCNEQLQMLITIFSIEQL